MLRKTLIVVVAASCSLTACSKKAPATLPPAPAGSDTAQVQPGTPAGIVPGSQTDFLARMNGQNTIFFDTDRFNIDSADAAALQAQAAWLQQYPQKRAVIEGHADERGTREYNLALGERRANAAKNYLVSIGVASGRLTVVSHGKERPAAVGSDESSWARNRRAVTVTID